MRKPAKSWKCYAVVFYNFPYPLPIVSPVSLCYMCSETHSPPERQIKTPPDDIHLEEFGAADRIRTCGLSGRRTTTGWCRPTMKRKFCWLCTFTAKTRKSPLLVVTTGFFGFLQCRCTVVVKRWSAANRQKFRQPRCGHLLCRPSGGSRHGSVR